LISTTVEALKAAGIRVSIVGLSPEMYVLKTVCKETGGEYTVALSTAHFEELLLAHVSPPLWAKGMQQTLVPMGFPTLQRRKEPMMCVCHLRVTHEGYICPRCRSLVCNVPSKCRTCTLNLVSATDIARSFHHLFPMKPFQQCEEGGVCVGCRRKNLTIAFRCPDCREVYCSECRVLAEGTLFHCPTCTLLEDPAAPSPQDHYTHNGTASGAADADGDVMMDTS